MATKLGPDSLVSVCAGSMHIKAEVLCPSIIISIRVELYPEAASASVEINVGSSQGVHSLLR